MMTDHYHTIAKKSTSIYKEKGSKFIGIAIPVFSEEDFKTNLQQLKKEYYDARHHCYGFRIGADKKLYRYSDDGEPSSTAGKPIFGQIRAAGLTNIMVVVVRYFGGTKLGTGGLITAYKAAAKEAIEAAKIIQKTVDNLYEIQFDYLMMNEVMNLIKKHKLEIILQQLEEIGTIQFSIRQSESDKIIKQFEKIEPLKIILLKTV